MGMIVGITVNNPHPEQINNIKHYLTQRGFIFNQDIFLKHMFKVSNPEKITDQDIINLGQVASFSGHGMKERVRNVQAAEAAKQHKNSLRCG